MKTKPLTEAQLALLNKLDPTAPRELDGRVTRAAENLAVMKPPLAKKTREGWILTVSGEKRRVKETVAVQANAAVALDGK